MGEPFSAAGGPTRIAAALDATSSLLSALPPGTDFLLAPFAGEVLGTPRRIRLGGAAARGLGRITGRVDVEDILERIFADFCIGK